METTTTGGGQVEHGERVPTLALGIFSNIPGMSDIYTQWAEIYKENLASIGITAEVTAQQSNGMVQNILQDKRVIHGANWQNSAGQFATDPDIFLRLFSMTIGSSRFPGWVNWSQWANCDFEEAYARQLRATTQEERREAINEAISIMSNDKIHLTQMPLVSYGAWRKDQIELAGTGVYGTGYPLVLIKSRHRESDGVISTNVGATEINTTNPENLGGAQQLFGTLLYSPLVDFDENGELINVLAESHEITNEGKRHYFRLRDGLTFHDGEPLTTEDVDFTFKLHLNNPQWAQSLFEADIFDSTEVIDDRQWAINWSEPNLSSINVNHRFFEILPKHIWEAATDAPTDFIPEEPIGSGPYRLENFEVENFANMVPHDGYHPLAGNSELLLRSFKDLTSTIQAFKQGEINLISGLSRGGYQNIQESMSSDRVGLDFTPTAGPIYWLLQCHTAPVKFPAFRDAMGTVMDRQLMNQVGFDGENEIELHSTMFMKNNPWRPADDLLYQFTDDPSGDPDAARQKLADAGYTWDDDGNLRYPPDADLAPLWPQGEDPPEDAFACISPNDDGGYTVDV